jgi:hypothetical protein
MINSQIANPQIYLEFQSKNLQFVPDPHWFTSNTFFYLHKYIFRLRNAISLYLKTVPKIMYLRICGSFNSVKIIGFANCKSANRKKYVFRKLQHLLKIRKSMKIYFRPANLRFCDLRNLFSDRPPLLFSKTAIIHDIRKKRGHSTPAAVPEALCSD